MTTMTIEYPTDVQTIAQIELTSKCNLKCKYCPHSKGLDRPTEDISMETYERALEWVKHFISVGTQDELSLTGLGESLLHPDFAKMVGMARNVIGFNHELVIATNGILLTEDVIAKIAPHKPDMYISAHRPEKVAEPFKICKEYGLNVFTNTAFADNSFNWAGQVDWPVTAKQTACEYLLFGRAVVLQDGQFASCCLDAHGKYPIGHVDDKIGSLLNAPNELCKTCHMQPLDKVGMTYKKTGIELRVAK